MRKRASLGRRATAAALLTSLGLVLTGCWDAGPTELQRQLASTEAELRQAQRDLLASQAAAEQLERQLSEARTVDPRDLERLFYPRTLRVDDLTSAFDDEAAPGDDGIIVYLQPIDQQGDVVKAAGDIRVELFDLAAQPQPRLLGRHDFSAEQAPELWYGKLWTSHYTLRCPFDRARPTGSSVTVVVSFTDLLSERVITAQAVVPVSLK